MLSERVTLGVLRVSFECRATALLFSDRLGPLLQEVFMRSTLQVLKQRKLKREDYDKKTKIKAAAQVSNLTEEINYDAAYRIKA